MSTSARFFVILTAAALAAAPAFAQTASDPGDARIEYRDLTPTTTAPGDAADLGTASIGGSGATQEWIDKTLVTRDGDEIGVITDVVTDESGAVTEVHATVGGVLGWFAETVVIPADRILMQQDDRLFAEMTAEEIQQARSD